MDSIEKRISQDTLENVYYAYLSEKDGVGTIIYQYLKLGWSIGPKIENFHSNSTVKTLHGIAQKVKIERHRMLGLLRFRLLAGPVEIYYAAMEPDNNILALITPHFAKRLSDQNWVIHDLPRGLAALYNQKEWIITEAVDSENFITQEAEEYYQGLWQEYFKRIAIEGRINPNLQRSFMPVRYWKHLVEKK